MAKEIAADGEGATKLLEVTVSGAPSFEIAQDLAKAIAGGSLVKAAIFGADPNSWPHPRRWLERARARKGYPVDPAAARVKVQGVVVYDKAPTGVDPSTLKAARHARLEIVAESSPTERAGPGTCTAYGCDLSYDYVKINADYTSLIVPTETGGVAKDDRLSNYSPNFKVSALGRGAQLHPEASPAALVCHQVRRRRDGEGLAEEELLQRHLALEIGGAQTNRRPRRRSGDHAHPRETGRQGASSSMASA